MPAISRDANQSVYKMSDGTAVFTLTLGHSFKARNRVFARLQRDTYSSDPLVPANSVLASMTATITMDFPNVGITTTDVQNLANALTAFASSANVLKLANGET